MTSYGDTRRATRRRRAITLAMRRLAPIGIAAPALAPTPANAGDDVPRSRHQATDLSDAFVHVAKRLGPSVVQIEITTEAGASAAPTGASDRATDSPVARARASGVVLKSDGAIVTNNSSSTPSRSTFDSPTAAFC